VKFLTAREGIRRFPPGTSPVYFERCSRFVAKGSRSCQQSIDEFHLSQHSCSSFHKRRTPVLYTRDCGLRKKKDDLNTLLHTLAANKT